MFLTPEHRKTKEWLGLRIYIFDEEPAFAEAVTKILEQRAPPNVFRPANVNGNGNQVVQIAGSNIRCASDAHRSHALTAPLNLFNLAIY